LLKEYEGLFAASDSDYGRTNVVKHTIATGSAHPIKQPPRRLPDVLVKEVDKQVKGMLNNPEIHKVQTLSQKRFCVYHYPHIPLASTPNIGRVSKTSSYRINDQMSHQCVVMGRHH
jgi:hypothetical protein